MDWGPIVFGAIGAAFLLLIILAIRNMAAKKRRDAEAGDEGADDQEQGDEQGVEPDPAEDGDEDDEAEGDEAEGDEAEGGETEDEHAAMRTTRPDTPDAIRSQGSETPVPAEPPKQPEKRAQRRVDRAEEKARLTKGLAKTRGGFIAKLGSLFRGKADLDAAMLDQVEEILFTADIGVRTSQELIEGLRRELGKKEIKDPAAIWDHIKRRSAELLATQLPRPLDVTRAKPFVLLVVGVNGTGKTTTIGKLAARLREEGHEIVLAAADTFRAAAVDQLKIWGDRAQCAVVSGKEGADPSSVIIDALKHAQETGAQVVIADTAGRLHTKVDLMEELQKVRRSIAKRVEGAPHETLLVLDSTMGQNAIAQAKMFKEALSISGLILTKLDGTAKGGVVLGICHELQLPVRFIGIGEQLEDLREFDPESFVEALYEGAGKEAT
jgi:fused signal recognition particle receptor